MTTARRIIGARVLLPAVGWIASQGWRHTSPAAPTVSTPRPASEPQVPRGPSAAPSTSPAVAQSDAPSSRLRQWFDADTADRCRVIYGGSVKPDNIVALIAERDVDRALVGGTSLEVRSFLDIVSRSRPAAV